MQSLQEFTTNKSCPEFSSVDADSVYSSLTGQSGDTSCDLLQHAISFPLLNTLAISSGSLAGGLDSGNDPDLSSTVPDLETDLDLGTMTTTVEEEKIEILSSCHVESVKSTPTPRMKPSRTAAPVSVKLIARLEDHDPTQVNRKRVVRAVGVVTFLLLLFSVILIGISLNMSKSIDDMASQTRTTGSASFKDTSGDVKTRNSYFSGATAHSTPPSRYEDQRDQNDHKEPEQGNRNRKDQRNRRDLHNNDDDDHDNDDDDDDSNIQESDHLDHQPQPFSIRHDDLHDLHQKDTMSSRLKIASRPSSSDAVVMETKKGPIVRASRHPNKNYVPRKTNRTLFEDS